MTPEAPVTRAPTVAPKPKPAPPRVVAPEPRREPEPPKHETPWVPPIPVRAKKKKAPQTAKEALRSKVQARAAEHAPASTTDLERASSEPVQPADARSDAAEVDAPKATPKPETRKPEAPKSESARAKTRSAKPVPPSTPREEPASDDDAIPMNVGIVDRVLGWFGKRKK